MAIYIISAQQTVQWGCGDREQCVAPLNRAVISNPIEYNLPWDTMAGKRKTESISKAHRTVHPLDPQLGEDKIR